MESGLKSLSVLDAGCGGLHQKEASDVVCEDTRSSETSVIKPSASKGNEASPVGDGAALPRDDKDDSGARAKVFNITEGSHPVFRSLIYGNEPDPEPLSIFVGNPLMASQEEVLIARERGRSEGFTGSVGSAASFSG